MPKPSPLDYQILQQCLANIASSLVNFKTRPTQQHMIEAVFETLFQDSPKDAQTTQTQQGQSILVIEGPTGTGKSLGYLLPAIIAAKSLGKHLVISSATIMLQEQLANKDIPFIAQHAGFPITYTIAKGRGRYACNLRLQQIAANAKQMDWLGNEVAIDAPEKPPTERELEFFKQLWQQLDSKNWSGDRDTLAQTIPDSLWGQITNDRHGCLKRDCAHFNQCSFYASRTKLEQVDVVIVNHNLLLADLSMGGGVILPPLKDTFYCIDEAHHLADKAIKQFAASHSIYGVISWLEKISITVNKIETALKDFNWNGKIIDAVQSINQTLRDLSIALHGLFSGRQFNTMQPILYRCELGQLPHEFSVFAQTILPSSKSLLTTLLALQEAIRRHKAKILGKADEGLFDRLSSDLGFYIARVENLTAVWELLHHETSAEEPPIAKWFTAELYKQGTETEFTLSASPVRAADLLDQRFWRKLAGAVLTSATLRSLGSFDALLSVTGLYRYPETTCIALESPFNFNEQGALIIPAMKNDPKNPEAHTQEIISMLPSLLPLKPGEGSLMLFSAKKQMHAVACGLPQAWQKYLLIQGARSKEVLIEEHFRRIDSNQPSILFGLASFAEGLDLPGKACTHLIIAKLPFAVPDDPVSLTLAEWIEQHGGNAFLEMTLPETSIRLIQAVGRLIRSETDYGTVTIFDNRLITKAYGHLLKNSLPPFRTIPNSIKENPPRHI
jgi:ATP-dependent DNA helicase DinG